MYALDIQKGSLTDLQRSIYSVLRKFYHFMDNPKIMDNPRMRFYSHPDGRGLVLVSQDSDRDFTLRFLLASQYAQDGSTSMFLARHQGFPSVVGLGTSRDEAAECLKRMIKTYLSTFLEQNGMDLFERRLGELGFVRSREDEAEEEQRQLRTWGEPSVMSFQSTTPVT